MTQTPEPVATLHDEDPGEPLAFKLNVASRPTEMGFEVRVTSQPVNLTVEMDLDWDPEYLHGLLQCMPQIIEHQMERVMAQGDGS